MIILWLCLLTAREMHYNNYYLNVLFLARRNSLRVVFSFPIAVLEITMTCAKTR